MKNLHLFIFTLSIVFFISCTSTDKKTSYTVEQHTDKQGYNYETVSNDPTGLRLYTLDNGLKVYLSRNNDEPRIQTYLAVRAGSSFDPSESTGLAHYLEHMLFKGTDQIGTSNWEEEKVFIQQISDLYEQHKMTSDEKEKESIYQKIDSISFIASKIAIPNEYDKMVASLGATGTNAHTWYDETVYHNKIPSNELNKFLLLESEKFSQLVLRLFHTELEAVYEEFNRTQDDDSYAAYFAMLDGLFPTHPYGQQTAIGTAEHLKNPSMVHINNFFDTYYVPNNMALVLVGDLEFDETIQKVDETFGKLKGKELERPVLPKEEPIVGVVEREVFGPNNENISIAFRTDGAGSEEEKYITLIDMILANSNAGLMDLNLNKKQLVQRATSSPTFNNDYGFLTFSGIPKDGQSLDEVKDLMLEQAEKIKSGEFDAWMIEAVVNDLKLSETRRYESSSSLASMYYNSFIQGQQWSDRVQFLEDLKKISKEELVAFANKFFVGNYVAVYKRQGEAKNIVKVKNPGITPIALNRDAQSQYLIDFNTIVSEDLKPVFVDYKTEIKKETLDLGVDFSHINNKTNDLFNLNLIFDMGKDHDRQLALAVGYLEYLGTDQYSAEELAKEFYKLGVNYSVNTGSDRSYVSISGLQENLDKGLSLLEHLLTHATVDQEAYNKYVASILKARADGKTNKANILRNGLNSYAQFGENSRLRDIYNADELQAMNPSELVDIIKDLKNYKHRVFYYGKNFEEAKLALNKHHDIPKELKDYPAPKEYLQLETGNQVYFVDYDMVQSELFFIAKGDQFDRKKMAVSSVFNSYFGGGLSSIVFQEIRESKSLAYSAYAGFGNASKKENDNIVYAYIGTQANKLPQAVDAMLDLLNDMPQAQEQFNNAKDAALKQIAAQRITKSNIFWNYESLLKRGIDYDYREDMYNEIQNMTMEDISSFFDQNIKGQNYSVSVIGNKKDLDLKALAKLGKVQEMDIDYLFNYKETAVKQ